MIFEKLFRWIKNKKYIKKYSKLIIVESMQEVPESIKDNIYLVRNNNLVKWVVLLCPCKKHNRIEVNLMQSRKPFWKCSFKKNKISLYPSVMLSDKCFCHFWLQENKAFICSSQHLI